MKQFAVILSKEKKREGDIYLPIGIIDSITKKKYSQSYFRLYV